VQSYKDKYAHLSRCWTALTSETVYFVNNSSGLRFEPSCGSFVEANDFAYVAETADDMTGVFRA
jgi:hypothetical protein